MDQSTTLTKVTQNKTLLLLRQEKAQPAQET